MLRKFALAVTTLAALFVATNASAQATNAQPRFGVGIAVGGFSTTDAAFEGGFRRAYVLVPIQVMPALRIEPMFGINTWNGAGTASASDITLGSGVFYTLHSAQSANVYVGGRLALDFVSTETAGGLSDSGVDIRLAAALGGEYYFSPHFSLGAEADMGYYSTDAADPGLPDSTGFYTAGYLIGRFYF
jgi:hypothetical protein